MVLDFIYGSDLADTEHEIDQLLTQVAVLRRRLNARRPGIARLPSEIHLEIFSYIVDEWREDHIQDTKQRSYTSKSYTWLPTITHICHYWRYIALGSPCLWRYVLLDVDASSSLEVVLERSQEAPIFMFCHIDYHDIERHHLNLIQQILLPHLHRIEVLQIATLYEFCPIYDNLFAGPLPLIETIIFTMGEIASDWDIEVSEEAYIENHVIPFRRWMKEDYNGLRTLSLACIPLLGIQAAIRPSLRRLSLRKLSSLTTMSMFLSVFENTPLLEDLCLLDATPPVPLDSKELPEPKGVVLLAHLQRLHIDSPGVLSLTNFLRHISYPALTSMKIDYSGMDLDHEYITPADIGCNLGDKILPSLRYVSLRAKYSGLTLYGWTESNPGPDLIAEMPEAPCRVNLNFEYIFQLHERRCQELFTLMVTKVMNGMLECLHLNIDAMDTRVRSSPWEDVFYNTIVEQAINVHTLYISSIYRLLSIFGLFDDDDLSQWPDPCISPAHLWIRGVESTDFLNDVLGWRNENRKMIETLSVPWRKDISVYKETAKLVGRLEIRSRE